MLRRLPIYLLLDCSESMAGDPLKAVETGVMSMISTLRKNPHALETAFLSVLTFDAKARVAAPLTELISFTMPKLTFRPGTSLGAALDLLREQMAKEIVLNTKEVKGDFKPLVFILTDGQPTDAWSEAAARLRSSSAIKATIYAIGCGDEVDFETLSKIAHYCLHTDDLTKEALGSVFAWVSASVGSRSTRPEVEGEGEVQDIPLKPGLKLIDIKNPPKFTGQNKRVYLHVLCSKTHKPFLIRYQLLPNSPNYGIKDILIVSDDFLSEGALKSPPIDANRLGGMPVCPHCGALGWFQCTCGTLNCINLEKSKNNIVTCANCHQLGRLAAAAGAFNVDGSVG
ncbi:MAG: VWA domain-containing protein [Deltaproteobacteria bacterium]|jgi:uncharacterized protein YegL|nr:VWA domain-containing protein [Deltaproteobacteria bacterium]